VKFLSHNLTSTEFEILAVSFLHSLTIEQAKTVFPFKGLADNFEDYRQKISDLVEEKAGWLSLVFKIPLDKTIKKDSPLLSSALIPPTFHNSAECIKSLYKNCELSQVFEFFFS
jgi:hypothetical protein